jgi:hypothetical protein
MTQQCSGNAFETDGMFGPSARDIADRISGIVWFGNVDLDL